MISVVVPTKNSAHTIGTCLASIDAQTNVEVELLVIDNHSTDDTRDIAKKYTRNIYSHGPERSAQRNFGMHKSSGDIVVFIDSDMTLEPTLCQEVSDLMSIRQDITSIFIPEHTSATGFWGRCRTFERDFYLIGEPSVEAARVYRRDIFLRLGGFDENISGGEDWDLSDRSARLGSQGRIRSSITHHEGHIDFLQQLRKKRYYGKTGGNKYIYSYAPLSRKIPYPFKISVAKQWYRFILYPVVGPSSIFFKFLEILCLILP